MSDVRLKYMQLSRDEPDFGIAFAKQADLFSGFFPPARMDGIQACVCIQGKIAGCRELLGPPTAGTPVLAARFDARRLKWSDLDALCLGGADVDGRLVGFSSLVQAYATRAFGEPLGFDGLRVPELLRGFEHYRAAAGYRDDVVLTVDAEKLERGILEHPLHFIHNGSCTGKTFCALSLSRLFDFRFIYRPNWSDVGHLENILCLAIVARKSLFVFDDLQCAPSEGHRLVRLLSGLEEILHDNGSVVVAVSWEKYFEDLRSTDPKSISSFRSLVTDVSNLRASLKLRLKESGLESKAPAGNIAILDALHRAQGQEKRLVENDQLLEFLLGCEVQGLSADERTALYYLATLGSYEFLPTVENLRRLGQGSAVELSRKVKNIRVFEGTRLYLGHRAVCQIVAEILAGPDGLAEKHTMASVITEYVGCLKPEERWRSVSQIIADEESSTTGRLLPIWRIVASFERQLQEQTKKDPLWRRAPSSLFFVARSAIDLGLSERYLEVIENFTNIFSLSNGTLSIETGNLLTNADFALIREKMKTEDEYIVKEGRALPGEAGSTIDSQQFHENWILGFGLGLRDAFAQVGRTDTHSAILEEIRRRQLAEGLWYPRRVPWVTSRILIGAGQAGLSCAAAAWVQKACEALSVMVGADGYWNANTGGWNNKYETTALVMEAFAQTGFQATEDHPVVETIAQRLLKDKRKWMVWNPQVTPESAITMVDGITSACVLLKNGRADDDVAQYLISTERHFQGQFFIRSGELDLNNNQSCALAQIPSFLIEAGWAVLRRDIHSLLDEYMARANSVVDGGLGDGIFISYYKRDLEESANAKKVAEFLKARGCKVFFDESLGGGDDSDEFMRQIKICGKLLLLGSANYVKQAKDVGTGLRHELTYITERAYQRGKGFVVPVVWRCKFPEGVPDGLHLNNGLEIEMFDEATLTRIAALLGVNGPAGPQDQPPISPLRG